MKKFFILFLLTCLAVVFLLSLGTVASARQSMANDWIAYYDGSPGPNSLSDNNLITATGDVCQLCHRDAAGKEPWNGYGWALWDRINIWGDSSNQQAFANVQALNSDNNSG